MHLSSSNVWVCMWLLTGGNSIRQHASGQGGFADHAPATARPVCVCWALKVVAYGVARAYGVILSLSHQCCAHEYNIDVIRTPSHHMPRHTICHHFSHDFYHSMFTISTAAAAAGCLRYTAGGAACSPQGQRPPVGVTGV
jgi:hypothetical protein